MKKSQPQRFFQLEGLKVKPVLANKALGKHYIFVLKCYDFKPNKNSFLV
jgi:hypothetical protein